ncbi:MAG: HNH endonuclease, partial [Actinomycetota bacterium]|nr:HNH endonuclease [Actinomycetota bacterium]
DPDPDPDPDPDEDPPTYQDRQWAEDTTDREAVYRRPDVLRAAAADEPATPAPGASAPHPHVSAPLTWTWSAGAYATALHQLRTTPVQPLDLHSDRYAVPKTLKRFLELRDRTCIFPGCPRKAIRCDKDHLIPWPRDSTSESNLADECEHHHQGKHDSLTVTRLPDGTFRWTTPCGITADRPPRPVLDAWTYRTLKP